MCISECVAMWLVATQMCLLPTHVSAVPSHTDSYCDCHSALLSARITCHDHLCIPTSLAVLSILFLRSLWKSRCNAAALSITLLPCCRITSCRCDGNALASCFLSMPPRSAAHGSCHQIQPNSHAAHPSGMPGHPCLQARDLAACQPWPRRE